MGSDQWWHYEQTWKSLNVVLPTEIASITQIKHIYLLCHVVHTNISLCWFQYGKDSLEKGRSRARKYSSDEENSETESDRNGYVLRPEVSLSADGGGATNVISREDLILVPDPQQNINNNNLAVPVRKVGDPHFPFILFLEEGPVS